MAAVCGKEETIMANTNTKTAPRSTKIKESFGSRLFDVVDVLIICVLLACADYAILELLIRWSTCCAPHKIDQGGS